MAIQPAQGYALSTSNRNHIPLRRITKVSSTSARLDTSCREHKCHVTADVKRYYILALQAMEREPA